MVCYTTRNIVISVLMLYFCTAGLSLLYWIIVILVSHFMKKNIIISTQLIDLGGVEKSLLGLLDTIDYERYSVDVFIFNHDGALIDMINKKANLLPEIPQYAALSKPKDFLIRTGQWRVAAIKMLATLKAKWKSRFFPPEEGKLHNIYHSYLIDYASRSLPLVSHKTYDIGIAFLHPNFVESRNIRAKKYWAWIHTDYSNLVIDPVMETRMWSAFDEVIAVSEECRNVFVAKLPSLAGKVSVMENIISYDYVQEALRSKEDASWESYRAFGGKKILTIGRFSYAKNMEMIPEIVREMCRRGCTDFKWYIIGFGGDEHLVTNLVAQYGLQEYVEILGKKTNPYIFISQCDVYVQPSRFEGKSVSVREAQLLQRPVIITNYPTAASQVQHGFDGLIVPLDEGLMAESVIKVLQDKELSSLLSSNCDPQRYTNEEAIEKFYQLADQE